MRIRTLVVVGLAMAVTPLATATAQDDEPDFLFGIPRGAFSLRGGYHVASANSDVFDFLSKDLTIERNDFNAFVLGIDVALTVHSRIDVLLGFEYSQGGTESEYRDFEENDGSPILQNTELTSVPLSGSIKLYLTPRGRDISRFAFVPSKARPYVGAGAGVIWYKLDQFGDFVDFVDLSIFTAQFESSGWGTEAHAFGGLDLQVHPRWYLSFEGRYLWADAGLVAPFVFDDLIDLAGLRITFGINFSF